MRHLAMHKHNQSSNQCQWSPSLTALLAQMMMRMIGTVADDDAADADDFSLSLVSLRKIEREKPCSDSVRDSPPPSRYQSVQLVYSLLPVRAEAVCLTATFD